MPPCAAILRIHPEFRRDVMSQCARCLSRDSAGAEDEDCLARLVVTLGLKGVTD